MTEALTKARKVKSVQRKEKCPAEVLPTEGVRELYRTVFLIRRAEECLRDLFGKGEVPGFIHLSIGQEAVSAGVMSVLGPDDTIASTHRGHGHAIAKGLPLVGFFAEILGKDIGLCRGRGGSMHVAAMSVGMLGANGIVGAGLSIALGSALAHKTLKRDALAAVFFGDGALAEGVVHETFNMAALWQLPILLVCENNGWSEFQPTSKQISFNVHGLSSTYRLPHEAVDGNDAVAVALAARRNVESIRAGDGPRVLECITNRVRGHFEGDAQKYRDTDEMASLAALDPVSRLRRELNDRAVPDAEISAIEISVEAQVADAVAEARNGAVPNLMSALADVYTVAGAL